jgi:hypothetical protein
VQGWLLRRIIARQPGWRLGFERIGVGPTGLDASGLEFAMPGVTASSAPVAIRVAPTRFFSKQELRIEQVEARKIRLTLTPAQLTPSAENNAPFGGVLRLLQAPLPWALDTAQLDGEIVMREGGESRVTGNFSLRGGGLTPSTPGEFVYELAADSMILPPGPDHKFTSAGTIRLAQTPDHGIARIAIEGDLHLPHYGGLSLPPGRLTLDVTATPAGENYAARLSLGAAMSLEVAARLDAARSILTGQATLHADQSAAASLLGDRLPRATLDGGFTFTLNLRNSDLDVAVTGDLDGRDWQKLLPQLAALDAGKGRLTAVITRRGGQLTLQTLRATLHGENSPAEASLTVLQPLDLRKLTGAPLAELALVHWPLEWANPFLADLGGQLAPGEFSAAWTIASDGANGVRLEPVRPAIVGPITFRGEKLPPLPLLNVSFRSHLAASAARVALTLDDFSARSPQGDHAEAQVTVSRDSASGEIRTTGKLAAALPTLFATAETQQPFTLNAGWDAALTGTRLRIAALDFAARDSASARPCLALELQQPFEFDLAKRLVVPSGYTSAPSPATVELPPDLLRLRFAAFPLARLSHWLPGQTVAGTFVSGESALRPSAEGGLALHTPVPWRLEGVSLNAAEATPDLRVDAQLSPAVTLRGDQLALGLDDITVTDGSGNCVTGRVGATAALAKQALTAELALEAGLPSLPHGADSFGPLHASLRAKFHNLTARIIGADEFDLRVQNSSGELLALNAPRPFLFGLSDSNTVAVSTLAPLRLKLDRFPLAWLRPWSGAIELDGTMAPVELGISSRIDKYSVRAAGPIELDNLSVRRAGREIIHDATVTLEPGLDLTVICVTQPKFELAYAGMAHLTDAKADFAGRHAIDLDLGLAFKGNETITLPDQIDLSTRVDFAALPAGLAPGLPARGTLVARINGDLLGAQPVELWARLAGLPAEEARDSLPPLEVTLRGKVSRDNVFAGGVELLLAASPRPTDAKFDVQFNFVEGGLNVSSGFRSQFIDGTALLALARAFPSATPPAVAAPPAQPTPTVAPPRPAVDAALPFWGELRGSFDLDIGAVQFAPYRIDRVRGRLDADQRTLVLHDLAGEMFAGRWGGGLRIEHEPGITTGEHTLAGEFHIEQFESARVVQTVFPNQLASVDARINVRSRVASHGNSFVALIDHSAADFSVDGEKGVVRLTVPHADLISTAAVFGGTVLLSPELRALGRLLKKFAEMPVEQLRITGRRAEGGEVTLDEFRFESSQARLLGHGRIPAESSEPLMNRPLELSLELAAKDELAVILGGMSLLEKRPRPDGFRAMRQPFTLGGRAGAPDTAPLYDLLARAVGGSSGTWGFLMRKVQAKIVKNKIPAAGLAP